MRTFANYPLSTRTAQVALDPMIDPAPELVLDTFIAMTLYNGRPEVLPCTTALDREAETHRLHIPYTHLTIANWLLFSGRTLWFLY